MSALRNGLLVLLPLAGLAAGYGLGRHAAPPPVAVAQAAEPAGAGGTVKTGVVAGSFSAEFVRTAAPQAQTVADSIAVSGKLSLDRRRLRIAAARVAGRLGRVFVTEGEAVRAGQPLAEIYSPDYIAAQNELLLARRFRDTLAGAADAALRGDAQETWAAAGSRLRALGANEADIARLQKSGAVEEYLTVRAPIGGVVIQRNVDAGGYLNIGDSLMSIADTASLWLGFNAYDGDSAALRLGQALRFSSPSLPGRSFDGQVSFIAPALDPASHTLPARCDIPNADGALRPEMYVSGELRTGERQALLVPRTAVFRLGERDFLFVREGERYRKLAVQGRPYGEGQFAVTGGLDADAVVVVEGAVLLNQLDAQG